MKVFLIGMPGTGKTYWSKRLAAKLKTGGYDLDYLIEADEERSIAEIFAAEGEAFFREAEAKILRWFAQKKTFILATGGGTPCFHENLTWMKKNGLVIWIDESVELLCKRLLPEKDKRPLLKDFSEKELLTYLNRKLKERRPVYEQAHYHLSMPDLTEKKILQIIRSHE